MDLPSRPDPAGQPVDWPTYRAQCERPDMISRWMLEQTAELMTAARREDLAAALLAFRAASPLPKPPDFRGGPATDMFMVTLTESAVSTIAQLVAVAVHQGGTTTGTRGRGLGGFREAWMEFARLGADQPAPE